MHCHRVVFLIVAVATLAVGSAEGRGMMGPGRGDGRGHGPGMYNGMPGNPGPMRGGPGFRGMTSMRSMPWNVNSSMKRCVSCHTDGVPGFGSYSAARSSEGGIRYGQHCAVCHSDLENSSVRNASPARIQRAIRRNRGGMAMFAGFSTARIRMISHSLVSLRFDGAALYEENCSACHGELLYTNILRRRRTPGRIYHAIRNLCGEPALGGLTIGEISAIARSLRTGR